MTDRKLVCQQVRHLVSTIEYLLDLFDTDKAAADRVRSVWDCTILDSVISTGPDTVCEARAAWVF